MCRLWAPRALVSHPPGKKIRICNSTNIIYINNTISVWNEFRKKKWSWNFVNAVRLRKENIIILEESAILVSLLELIKIWLDPATRCDFVCRFIGLALCVFYRAIFQLLKNHCLRPTRTIQRWSLFFSVRQRALVGGRSFERFFGVRWMMSHGTRIIPFRKW